MVQAEGMPEAPWFARAVAARASDLHLEPTADGFRLRMRVLGRLVSLADFGRREGETLLQRLKLLARLNIAERRLPQDGAFDYVGEGGRRYEVRVATLPTVAGEKLTARFLYPEARYRDPTDLGMPPEQAEVVRAWLRSSAGLILVAGPTGSGKTTTLYALVGALDPARSVIYTVEDPVEARLPGVHQIAVADEIGLTFAAGLRAILRHDPDALVIGEIRDRETAEIAVRAALSGTLVLATIHADDAGSAVFRLLELGAEPAWVSRTLLGVIGQRMHFRMCIHCGGTGNASGAARSDTVVADGRTTGPGDGRRRRVGLENESRGNAGMGNEGRRSAGVENGSRGRAGVGGKDSEKAGDGRVGGAGDGAVDRSGAAPSDDGSARFGPSHPGEGCDTCGGLGVVPSPAFELVVPSVGESIGPPFKGPCEPRRGSTGSTGAPVPAGSAAGDAPSAGGVGGVSRPVIALTAVWTGDPGGIGR
ncbi:ATPase, T2SS/T4P/T4SS family [Hydrogenibacillus schlegelii]|uniref:Bacterial type II secretion system protein E domain-containing protein n=1 Tax=Hydrogenibacillus schlegelii TaxID=1484 RepID=A0A179IQH3_HYDSH|nr:ATPase, T2SS/T4P/T4SS family [Hydrogenibacillus schlegelii]OAR04585.1 hypothetical protein SA87_08575 [Hydrogenibacillus schlegelii]